MLGPDSSHSNGSPPKFVPISARPSSSRIWRQFSVPSGSWLGISCDGQLPVQTSAGKAEAAELAPAGRMAAMRTAATAIAILVLAAGCGGSGEEGAPTEEVFQGVSERGTAQNVRCEEVGV